MHQSVQAGGSSFVCKALCSLHVLHLKPLSWRTPAFTHLTRMGENVRRAHCCLTALPLPWQLETGIKGVTPGPDTEEYLANRERELRTLGGLSMAALAAVTQLFDAWCQRTLGVAIGTLSLLLLVGLVTSAVRQARFRPNIPTRQYSTRTAVDKCPFAVLYHEQMDPLALVALFNPDYAACGMQVTALVQEPRLESMLERERSLLMPQLSP